MQTDVPFALPACFQVVTSCVEHFEVCVMGCCAVGSRYLTGILCGLTEHRIP